jgi:hypothetical protein
MGEGIKNKTKQLEGLSLDENESHPSYKNTPAIKGVVT